MREETEVTKANKWGGHTERSSHFSSILANPFFFFLQHGYLDLVIRKPSSAVSESTVKILMLSLLYHNSSL